VVAGKLASDNRGEVEQATALRHGELGAKWGELPPVEGGRETLAVFAEKWWKAYAVPNLAPKTKRIYAELWDRHVEFVSIDHDDAHSPGVPPLPVILADPRPARKRQVSSPHEAHRPRL